MTGTFGMARKCGNNGMPAEFGLPLFKESVSELFYIMYTFARLNKGWKKIFRN